ncbi:hypothetical protein HYPBUDRAFT_153447 [Hyphopichia burtonii NRRL Y-1933]|uniref:Uncharacterized protein n=1 Tax=Hyphopichia burtonii NRRL Y-1933 TaxID=984485 RepID=A0A1E4RHL8_9ASCO|nr:hypothetical protein HYPBUDRAFT_153447 [Hyphopichia burtonii NRRL Y-1933]ODV66763.1 hypothetical protein HYPBUDRAFT_153447 [Hyphopichia burtonii NRRL Y-1933]
MEPTLLDFDSVQHPLLFNTFNGSAFPTVFYPIFFMYRRLRSTKGIKLIHQRLL